MRMNAIKTFINSEKICRSENSYGKRCFFPSNNISYCCWWCCSFVSFWANLHCRQNAWQSNNLYVLYENWFLSKKNHYYISKVIQPYLSGLNIKNSNLSSVCPISSTSSSIVGGTIRRNFKVNGSCNVLQITFTSIYIKRGFTKGASELWQMCCENETNKVSFLVPQEMSTCLY